MANNVKENKPDIDKMIGNLVSNAQKALDGYMKLDQEQVDKIVHAMALAGLDNHMEACQNGRRGNSPRRI